MGRRMLWRFLLNTLGKLFRAPSTSYITIRVTNVRNWLGQLLVVMAKLQRMLNRLGRSVRRSQHVLLILFLLRGLVRGHVLLKLTSPSGMAISISNEFEAPEALPVKGSMDICDMGPIFAFEAGAFVEELSSPIVRSPRRDGEESMPAKKGATVMRVSY
ncbi:hypothetical protein Nepgr_020216 [Nepenthes gracilis]|uniref:Uncharacterized protein n=1 Tax=Nepenthes gracilis TaxID=150966 RepID=A0AAD3XVZ2_NEPGR|nr:hypothetical protein Nepgr_020216 [Nepenthes gracilis]